jgi:thiamine pyrophosphokinase
MRAVIVAHGDVLPSDRAQINEGDLLIAADGGALALERWRIVPHLVVGDMDSLGQAGIERITRKGAAVAKFDATKDESDLELAVAQALAGGVNEILLLGVLGGDRLDHEVANLLLLADPQYAAIQLEARHGALRVRPLRGPNTLEIAASPGTTVTLIPVGGDAEGIETDGLRFPLRKETLAFGRGRGLSNVVDRSPATVSLRNGSLLVFEIPFGGT